MPEDADQQIERISAATAPEEPVAKEWITKASGEREQVAKSLAFWLVGALFASLGVHYSAIIILTYLGKPTDQLDRIFNSWLPVISGFVGSAVTYYYTKKS